MRPKPRPSLLALALVAALFSTSCRAPQDGSASGPQSPTRLVVWLQPLGGNPKDLDDWIALFEKAHPGVEVIRQMIPNASDVAHQYFLTALEGGANDFDLLVVDVVWV